MRKIFATLGILAALLAYPQIALADYTLSTGVANGGFQSLTLTTRWVAQRFVTVGAGTVSGNVPMTVCITSGTTGTTVAGIQADSAGHPSGTDIGVSAGVSVAGHAVCGSTDTLTYDFSGSPATLAAGTTYWLVVRLTSISGNFQPQGREPFSYQAGQDSTDSGATWSADRTDEIAGITITVVEAAAVAARQTEVTLIGDW